MRKIVLLVFAVLSMCCQVAAQNRQVTGTVTDPDGQVLVGASVFVKGTTTGTSTDSRGKYSLSAPANGTLQFSYLGYESKEVPVAGKTVVDCTLESSATGIDNVVVIGYGSGSKVGTTAGSVVRVKGEKLENKPSVNVTDALQGQVAGLEVYTSSGEPTTASSIRLHGVGSLTASSTPLILLDGTPIDAGTLVSLNPNDIESFNVLKDASATSIYGARAANGVIYVTTKRGVRGENATVRVNVQYGFSQPASSKYSVMTAQELLDYQREFVPSWMTQSRYDAYVESGVDTNWRKYLYRQHAPTLNADLSVSGGSEKTSYYLSGSYANQQGTDPRSGVKKYTVRTNVDTNANKWLKAGINLGISYDDRQLAAATESLSTYRNNMAANSAFAAILYPSYVSPYEYNEETGRYDGPMATRLSNGRVNPRYWNQMHKFSAQNWQINADAYVQVELVKNLRLKSKVGADSYIYNQTGKDMPSYLYGSGEGYVGREHSNGATVSITNTIDYNFQRGNHTLYLLGGQESTRYNYTYFYGYREGQTDDRLMMMGTGTSTPGVGDERSAYAFNSLFARAEYGYANKYVVDASVRRDASSRFGKNNRAAVFYAFGAMWDAKKELFLADNSTVTALKFKVSYGTQGNAGIDNYAALGTVTTTKYDDTTGWILNTLANDDLGWETQKLFTVVGDIALWDRIRLTAEFYNRVTEDMLMNVPYPTTSGYASGYKNIGGMRNRGIDLTFGADIVRSKDWYVGVNINFNYNKNEVTKLFNGYRNYPRPNYMLCYTVGRDAGELYMEEWLGVDPETGRSFWKTVDDQGNEGTTSNFANATPVLTGKSRYAPYTGGFGVEARWKGLSMSAQFSWNKGKYIVNNGRYFLLDYQNYSFNRDKTLLNTWRQPGDVTTVPRFGEAMQFDTRLLEDASFLRLKNLTVAYSLPASLLGKSGFIKGLNIYFTGRNLLTFTKYTGLDPEMDTNLSLGNYPQSRQFVGGIQLTF